MPEMLEMVGVDDDDGEGGGGGDDDDQEEERWQCHGWLVLIISAAVEGLCGMADYSDGLLHGECVAIGMVLESNLARAMGLLHVIVPPSLPPSLPQSINQSTTVTLVFAPVFCRRAHHPLHPGLQPADQDSRVSSHRRHHEEDDGRQEEHWRQAQVRSPRQDRPLLRAQGQHGKLCRASSASSPPRPASSSSSLPPLCPPLLLPCPSSYISLWRRFHSLPPCPLLCSSHVGTRSTWNW
eukprot:752659-Hanusia_phi.AAC.3